jgi:histidinol-phosphatase (PHP family)
LILSLKGHFTLSDDSHGPLAVGLHYDQAFDYLQERGVEELYYLRSSGEGVTVEVVEGRPWLDAWRGLLDSR